MMRYSNRAKEGVDENILDIRKTKLSASCPQGFLTPREIVGYLRAWEKQTKLPTEVDEHLNICDVCNDNWNFIRLTDPIFQEFRQRRVELMVATVGEVRLPLKGEQAIPSRLDEDHTQQVAQAITQVVSSEAIEQVTIEKFTPGRVLQMCTRVQKIPNKQRRYWKSKDLSAECRKEVIRMEKRGEIDTTVLLNRLLGESSDTVDLAKLKIPLRATATFACSLPQTSFFRGLLQRNSKGKIIFRQKEFQARRGEFDEFDESMRQFKPVTTAR